MVHNWSALGAGVVVAALLLPTARGQVEVELGAEPTSKAYLGIAGESDAAKAGVAVRELDPESPAAKAGVKIGDVIARADGKKVTSFDELAENVRRHKAGDKLTLGVIRDGKESDIVVTLGARQGPRPLPGGDKRRAFLGIQTRPLPADVREKLGIDKGIEVGDVLADSPAAKAGLKEKDVITAVDDQAVGTPEELRDAVQKTGAGKDLELRVLRGKEKLELKARLEATPRPPIPLPGQGFDPPGAVRPGNLETRVQELERRLREVEQKLNERK